MNVEIERIKKLAKNKKISFVYGNFNVIHPGHLRLLRFAKECGDFLLVGIFETSTDVISIQADLRLEGIQSISFIDHAFLLRGKLEDFLRQLKPHSVFKGKEFEDKFNSEQEIIESYGGKLVFGSGEHVFSSVDLIRKEILEFNPSTIRKPIDYLTRHSFSLSRMKECIQKFKELRVVVIGDLIIDEYITCDPLGMSQEDPTIVVTPISTEKFIGGAGIVAAHAQSLGAEVVYYTVTGKDETHRYAEKKMNEFGVIHKFFVDESRPTTLKQRYRACGKTLLRVSHLRQHDISHQIAEKILYEVKDSLKNANLLIFSDFNYGCLPQSLIDHLAEYCTRKGIMMVADSQSSSQVGDISRFKNVGFITATEREARLALKDFTSGLVVIADKLKQKTNCKDLVIKLGAEGMLIHSTGTEKDRWHTDNLPAFNTVPKDISGAGDSFLTVASMAMATGSSIWKSAYIGSIAAACQVGRIGNIPLKIDEIVKEIDL